MAERTGRGGNGSEPSNRQPQHKQKKRPRRRWFWRTVGILFLVMVMAGIGAAAYVGNYVYEVWKATPDVTPSDIEWSLASVVYDRNGKELQTLHAGEDRILIKLTDVPQHVIDAFVAIEDARFWEHKGVDPYRILGAAWHDVKVMLGGGGTLQGASTITQQLARNAFLSHDQTVARKVKEALLAIKIEQNLSKQEILEKYLNEIWFGSVHYGLGTAAKFYFGKDVSQLTVAEGAMLAGMVKNPARYDPYSNMDEARERMNIVLAQMVKYGYLTEEEAAKAADQKLTTPGLPARGPAQAKDFTGDDFVDYVLNVLQKPELAEQYGLKPFNDQQLFQGGYKIYTTLDPAVQALADEAVATVMNEQYEKNRYAKYMAMPPDKPQEWIQAAVVVLDPTTGEVKAIVGGRGPRTGSRLLNRATDTVRQPGSTFKPLAAYVPAVEELGYGPGTVIDDSPYMYDEKTGTMWPDNYDHKYGGLTPMRVGLQKSINAMAVRLASQVGKDKIIEYPQKMGIRTLVSAPQQPNDQNLATALGGITRGVRLIELAEAYGTLANMGLHVDPVVITKIVDHEGNVVFEAKPERKQVIKPSTAYLVTEMLQDVIHKGTGYGGTQGFNNWPVAGKTGTTEHNTDAWFVGYTRNLVAGVWNGYDNQDKQRYLPYTGSAVPVMVWDYIMKRLVTERPPDWEKPKDIISVDICVKTGLLPSPYCADTRSEHFVRGTEPKQFDDQYWTTATVVKEAVTQSDGSTREVYRLYRPGCAGIPEQKVFLVRPDFVRHPDPGAAWKYAPADAYEGVPWEYCSTVDVFPGTGTDPGGTVDGGTGGDVYPGTTIPLPPSGENG